MVVPRDMWEETSFQLELRQTNPTCVSKERDGLRCRKQPPYQITFEPPVLKQVSKGL